MYNGTLKEMFCMVSEKGDVYMTEHIWPNEKQFEIKSAKLEGVKNICKIYPLGKNQTANIIAVDTDGNCYDLVDLYYKNK